MKYFWLFLLPWLFLPNLGAGVRTPFGTLEFSDFMVVPYVAALLLAARPHRGLRLYAAACCFNTFLAWALFSTVLMSWRYNDLPDNQLLFSLLKLGKFALYGFAGLMTASALATPAARRGLSWAVLLALCVLSVSLFLLQGKDLPSDARLGYSAHNAISVMMAVLLCYLAGLFVNGLGTPAWRKTAAVILPVALLGAAVSRGRGGWLAGLVGAVYLAHATGIRKRTLWASAVAACLVVAAYQYLPAFSRQVDLTLWPDPAFLSRYNSGVLGVDDGARITTWMRQAPHLVETPLLGTGFYHRSADSGLFATGSHNFWLQMFLETGLPGGLLMLGFVVIVWRHAGLEPAVALRLKHPVRAALVAAVVGGLGGEYFYGGIVLFSLGLVYAPIGSLPAQATHLLRRRVPVVAPGGRGWGRAAVMTGVRRRQALRPNGGAVIRG